jgi:beta-N-acetylhexosaminidase
MLLKPRDPVAAIAALVAAVRSGRVPGELIDDTVRRVLAVKARLGLFEQRFVDETVVGRSVGTAGHRAVAQEAADRSLTCLRNDGALSATARAAAAGYTIVNVNVEKVADDPGPLALAAELSAAFPGSSSVTLSTSTSDSQREGVVSTATRADLVIVSLFVQRDKYGDPAPLRDADVRTLDRILAAKPGAVIVMSYGNPHLIRKFPNAGTFLVGYGERGWFGNQSTYFGSFVRALRGEVTPAGRLPVHVSAAYPIGHRQP